MNKPPLIAWPKTLAEKFGYKSSEGSGATDFVIVALGNLLLLAAALSLLERAARSKP